MLRLKSCQIKPGYILIETLVSIAILSLGLILVLNAFSSEIKALRTSKNFTHANFLLEEKLCEIEKEGVIDVNNWRGKRGNFFDPTDSLRSNPERKKFDWEVDIDWLEDIDGSLLDIVALKVIVSWNELNIRQELYLTTYIRRKTT